MSEEDSEDELAAAKIRLESLIDGIRGYLPIHICA